MPALKPTDAIPGYTFDSTAGTITIPISAIGISASQAHATTGDFRLIWNGITKTVVDRLPTVTPTPTFFDVTETRTLTTGNRVAVTYSGKSTLALNTATLSFPSDS